MSYKAEWHEFAKELPSKEGLYIVCCNDGELSLKYFTKEIDEKHMRRDVFQNSDTAYRKRKNVFLNSKRLPKEGHIHESCISKKVTFWTDAPIPPSTSDKTAYEIRKLTARIEELKKQLKQYEEEK